MFVSEDDPTIVTSVIDWQSSSVEPAFMYADEVPDFAAPVYHPSSEGQAVGFNAELCRQAFDACLKGLVPRLCAARAPDDRLTRPFRYCHRTWRDGAVAFQTRADRNLELLEGIGTRRALPVRHVHIW